MLWKKRDLNLHQTILTFEDHKELEKKSHAMEKGHLTLHQTILTFDDQKEGLGKHCGKRRKCW